MILDSNSEAKIREISAIRYFNHPVSNTFHGRDIFAPVAAYLAKGLAPGRLGKLVSDAIIGDFTRPTQLADRRWRGIVLKIDRFGNVITNFAWANFGAIAQSSFRLKAGRRTLTSYYSTYAEAPEGQLFAIGGSTGYVEVSLNQSSAAVALCLSPGAVIELTLGSRASGTPGTGTRQPDRHLRGDHRSAKLGLLNDSNQ
jgi:hypothetical protein